MITTAEIRRNRMEAIVERYDGDVTFCFDNPNDVPRWFGVQTSDIGGVYFYTGETMRDVADSLAADLDDGWTIGGCFDLDTGQNYSVKVEVTCEVGAEVEGDVVLPEPDAGPVPGPNAPLAHVIDAMGDLNAFDENDVDESGWLAAHHATTILRDAMGEDVPPEALLVVAAWAIERAGRPTGLAASLLFPLRLRDDHRDHVELQEIGALLVEASESMARGVR